MILDYSEFIADRWGGRSDPGNDLPPQQHLFATLGLCPFCERAAETVDSANECHGRSSIDEYGRDRTAWQCLCGWWQVEASDWRHDSGVSWVERRVRSAILRKFAPSSSTVPIDALRGALLANPGLINSVSKKKTEELVGSVFSEVMACDVHHVGRTRDGGIDLVFVSAEEPVLVQVKNRDRGSRRWQAEPVATVREFLGAVKLRKGQRAILVTTASHFSPDAVDAASTAIQLNLVTQYDLVDSARFFAVLRVVTPARLEHWRSHFSGIAQPDEA